MKKLYKDFAKNPVRPLRRKCVLVRKGERVIIQNTYCTALGNFARDDYVLKNLRKTTVMSKTRRICGEPEYEHRFLSSA